LLGDARHGRHRDRAPAGIEQGSKRKLAESLTPVSRARRRVEGGEGRRQPPAREPVSWRAAGVSLRTDASRGRGVNGTASHSSVRTSTKARRRRSASALREVALTARRRAGENNAIFRQVKAIASLISILPSPTRVISSVSGAGVVGLDLVDRSTGFACRRSCCRQARGDDPTIRDVAHLPEVGFVITACCTRPPELDGWSGRQDHLGISGASRVMATNW
jgi:hypothetical protein